MKDMRVEIHMLTLGFDEGEWDLDSTKSLNLDFSILIEDKLLSGYIFILFLINSFYLNTFKEILLAQNNHFSFAGYRSGTK